MGSGGILISNVQAICRQGMALSVASGQGSGSIMTSGLPSCICNRLLAESLAWAPAGSLVLIAGVSVASGQLPSYRLGV